MSVTLRYLYKGEFYNKDQQLFYKKKLIYLKRDVDPDLLSKMELEVFFIEGVKDVDVVKEIWYPKSGVTLQNGLRQVLGDADIREMCEDMGNDRVLHLYVVQEKECSPSSILTLTRSPSCSGPRLLCTNSQTSHFQINPKAVKSKLLSSTSTRLQKQYQSKSSSSSDDDSGGSSNDGDGGLVQSESSTDDEDDPLFIENVWGESDIDDDEEFRENVDLDVDEAIPEEVHCLDVVAQEPLSDGDDVFQKVHGSDDYLSYSGSEGEGHVRYPEFNPLVDFKSKICLKSGMRFASNDMFRKALRQYAIEQGFDYYYLHNDKTKISAYCKFKCDCPYIHGRIVCVCKKRLCAFKACARKMGSDGTFQLKSFDPNHNCGWQDVNTKVTAIWLAEKYLEHYRADPKWRIKTFIQTIARDHGVVVTFSQAYKARVRACLQTQGHAPEQYERVWDYAATILKWNPGSTALVKVLQSVEVERPIFQRFYVCLNACKQGFLLGCRPIIGIDGCHLKGAYKGQLFCAVGKDGNENIFPLAYAVVELETKETWCWFLENLLRDIGANNLTFMSDRQKGLLEALKTVAPQAHTRVCVRHMYNNFKVEYPGKSYKDLVWAAARAATTTDFNECMEKIKSINEKAYTHLLKQDPSTWSLHGFNNFCKSDMLLNNCSESFNSCILEARELPVLSMCEWIRRKLMKMFETKSKAMRKHTGVLTPEVMKKIEIAKNDALRWCKCYGQGDRYEVDHGSKTFVVDLATRSCGCNMWDLTGIPCSHSICCILKRRLNVVQYVDPYYSKETYLRAYSHMVQPMPGPDEWVKTDFARPLPPKLVIQPGRPKKGRKKEVGETKSGKKTRYRHGKNKCSHCGEEGHYKNKCKNPPKPAPPSVEKSNKGGRPTKESTVTMPTKKRKYIKKVRSEKQPGTPEHDLYKVQLGDHEEQEEQGQLGDHEEQEEQEEQEAVPTQCSTVIQASQKVEFNLGGHEGESSTGGEQRKKSKKMYPITPSHGPMVTTRSQLTSIIHQQQKNTRSKSTRKAKK